MRIENIDHLGLVAGIIDELGLVELSDKEIAPHSLEHVSTGQVLKAMILNAMGFLSAPLYLFSEFFESKALSHLLGAGVEAQHLNDDRLGRSLDDLYAVGITPFFVKVALQAVERFGIDIQQRHLDSTSISVSGEYEYEATEEASEPTPIRLTRGYSRDHRPDLKQFLMTLVCSADGGVPLWLQVASGNASDSQEFATVMKSFQQNWTSEGVFVMDAAFYSASNLKSVGNLGWISRVPQTLSAAKTLIQGETTHLSECECDQADYRLWEMPQDYGGVTQRWILVECQSRQGDEPRAEATLAKQEKVLNRHLKALSQQTFASKAEAIEAVMAFQDTLTLHHLSQLRVAPPVPKRGRKRTNSTHASSSATGYCLEAQLERNDNALEYLKRQQSRFILATNQLDTVLYPADKVLSEYKNQQKVERGFRFLKDPLFFASSVFVKKPQRVEALALVMALTLLVYTLAERKLRQALAAQQQTVLNQRKRPTAKPTFRWIMQAFQGIHWVWIQGRWQISNLNDQRRLIIQLLGPPVERYYYASS